MQKLLCIKIPNTKILLVEDDLISRNMETIILRKHGFEVIAVENGKEAISKPLKIRI